MGAKNLQLIDFEQVETTAEFLKRIDPGVVVETIEDRCRSKIITGKVVFCCIDSICDYGTDLVRE